MAMIFVLAYNSSDYNILQPVTNELAKRGHYIFTDLYAISGFCNAHGPKALVLVSDILAFEHAEGLYAAKTAKWSNVPVISMQHGVPFGESRFGADSFMRYHAADHFCVWGDEWMPYFNPKGVKHITGNPALDYIQPGKKENVALLVPQINDRVGSQFMVSLPMAKRANVFIEKARNTGFKGKWYVRPHPADWKFPERMEQHERITRALKGELQPAADFSVGDALSQARLVVGMSTVIMEAYAYGCDIVPVHMDNWPDDFEERLPDIYGTWPLDGKASARVADVVEGAIRERLS